MTELEGQYLVPGSCILVWWVPGPQAPLSCTRTHTSLTLAPESPRVTSAPELIRGGATEGTSLGSKDLECGPCSLLSGGPALGWSFICLLMCSLKLTFNLKKCMQ